MHPDLGLVEAVHGVVEQLDEEVERRLIGAPGGRAVDGRLLDLDDLAPGRDQLPELGVEHGRDVPHELALVVVVHIGLDRQDGRGEVRRDRAELDGLLRA